MDNYLLTREETGSMIDDVGKIITCLFSLHILGHFINNESKLLSEQFIRQLLYLIVGIVFYHIIVKKHIGLKKI